MQIPIRNEWGNIVRYEKIDNPHVTPPTNFNPGKTKEKIVDNTHRPEEIPTVNKDINLGVSTRLSSNQVYWRGKNPQAYLEDAKK